MVAGTSPSGSLQELDYKEFRMFAMACIDRQMELEQKKGLQRGFRERLLSAMCSMQ